MKTVNFQFSNKKLAFVGGIILLSLLLVTTFPSRRTPPEIKAAAAEILPTDANLQAQADALLPLFDDMPPVKIYVSTAPIIKSGANIESGVAYTECEPGALPLIFVKQDFYQHTNQRQLTNILKHELTHAFFCRQKIAAAHDARFRRKFTEVGGFGN